MTEEPVKQTPGFLYKLLDVIHAKDDTESSHSMEYYHAQEVLRNKIQKLVLDYWGPLAFDNPKKYDTLVLENGDLKAKINILKSRINRFYGQLNDNIVNKFNQEIQAIKDI